MKVLALIIQKTLMILKSSMIQKKFQMEVWTLKPPSLWILLLLVVFNVLRFVMKFPLRDCANVPSLPLLDLQSLGFCQKRLHASHPSSWILNKLKTSITSHSQDLHFSSLCLDPHRIPTSRTLTTTEATRSQSTRGNRSSRTLQGTFPFPSRTSWTAAT